MIYSSEDLNNKGGKKLFSVQKMTRSGGVVKSDFSRCITLSSVCISTKDAFI